MLWSQGGEDCRLNENIGYEANNEDNDGEVDKSRQEDELSG